MGHFETKFINNRLGKAINTYFSKFSIFNISANFHFVGNLPYLNIYSIFEYETEWIWHNIQKMVIHWELYSRSKIGSNSGWRYWGPKGYGGVGDNYKVGKQKGPGAQDLRFCWQICLQQEVNSLSERPHKAI